MAVYSGYSTLNVVVIFHVFGRKFTLKAAIILAVYSIIIIIYFLNLVVILNVFSSVFTLKAATILSVLCAEHSNRR